MFLLFFHMSKYRSHIANNIKVNVKSTYFSISDIFYILHLKRKTR